MLQVRVNAALTGKKQNAEQTQLSVGELFHVIGTSSEKRDDINGRDCSLPESTASSNVANLDIDMVR